MLLLEGDVNGRCEERVSSGCWNCWIGVWELDFLTRVGVVANSLGKFMGDLTRGSDKKE